jgi:dihydrodipicolinate synthase/N-acetylneuraminate lyase
MAENELDFVLYCMAATPFHDDESLDEDGLRALIRRLVAAGNALCMTSPGAGEGHLLTLAEHRRVYEIAVAEAAGRVPVAANIPPAFTAPEVLSVAHEALAAGVDQIQFYQFLPPLGMVPSEGEQEAYWHEVLGAVDHPVAISFNPQVGYQASTEFIVRLCKRYDQIVEVNFPAAFLTLRDALPARIRVGGTLDLIPLGSGGIQLAESNIIPNTCRSIIDAYREGDLDKLRESYQLFQRFRNAVYQWHPATSRWVKMAFRVLGLGNGVQRKPYLLPDEADQRRMAEAFERLQIVEREGRLAAAIG